MIPAFSTLQTTSASARTNQRTAFFNSNQMNDLPGIDRRSFLSQLGVALTTTAFFGSGFTGRPVSNGMAEDSPNTHNMLVFGTKEIYLSHLPMFHAVNTAKTEFTSPHRYQVILAASFLKNGQNLQKIYTDDRLKNPNVRIYTLNPEEFVLTKLNQPPMLSGFRATVFRGHLEKGGQIVDGLKDIDVKINRIVHFRKFNPLSSQPTALKYLLFGNGSELFLAHYITRPPNFDQVLSVRVNGHTFTDAELAKGIEIIIPGKLDQAKGCLKEKQQVAGQIQTADPNRPLTITLNVAKEIYFEEGELLMPPTFDDTPVEKSAR